MKYETDSRKIKPGQTFVAIKGHTVDGHDFIDEAIKKGATKIICEREIDCKIPFEVVNSTQEYLNEHIASEYSHLFDDFTIIGVTGTNGKTTTCYLTFQLLQQFSVNVAYIGTIGFYYEDKFVELNNTTPDILTLYNLLLLAKEKNCKTIIMEVSSHALAFERLKGLKLDIAAFTNLTEDHLDYHKTMDAYKLEKLKIVDYLKDNGTLIVNKDDEAHIDFLNKFHNNVTIGTDANYSIVNYEINPARTIIDFKYQEETYQAITNLTSKFNIYNYLTALAILKALNYEINNIIEHTKNIKSPKGRCETFEINDAFAVIDFAHTPDAVEKVILAYKEFQENRLITIIGCGGDRDPIKRPIMGNIAAELSDFVIVTNDNPRTEDPQKIAEDILKGIKTDNYIVELDREKAIHKGLEMLEKNDLLLILGKGHETYQIIGTTKIPFNETDIILKWKKEYKTI